MNYEETAKRSTLLVSHYGATAILRRLVHAGYDPVTDQISETVHDYPATIVVLEYARTQVDGVIIKPGDKRVLIGPHDLAVKPKPNDFILVGEEKFRIEEVTEINPNGTVPVLFEARVH